MTKIDCRTPEMAAWCRRLHRLAVAETIFAALSLTGLLINLGITISTGIVGLMIGNAVYALFTAVTVLSAGISGLTAFDRRGRFYRRYKAAGHFVAAIRAVAVGVIQVAVLYFPLKGLTESPYSYEEFGWRTFRVLAWIEAVLIPAYVICFAWSCAIKNQYWEGKCKDNIVMQSLEQIAVVPSAPARVQEVGED